tara:strand:- start:424 stop:636 length:213 start_codon:yes stop_codon:yes gene_type:complete
MQSIKFPESSAEPVSVTVKYWLSISAVVFSLLVLLFALVDGAVINFRCSFFEFLSLECNRWEIFDPPVRQ